MISPFCLPFQNFWCHHTVSAPGKVDYQSELQRTERKGRSPMDRIHWDTCTVPSFPNFLKKSSHTHYLFVSFGNVRSHVIFEFHEPHMSSMQKKCKEGGKQQIMRGGNQLKRHSMKFNIRIPSNFLYKHSP